MKTLLLILLCAAFCSCSTTPKVDANGQPPPGWRVVPKIPTAF